jgi:two-component system, chemotaxis family, chemotaxis protein CheY
MDPLHARLLLVEDTIPIRHLVHELLEEAGFTDIDEAGDGSVAMEMLREVPYDLIITDWQMPRMNGRALVDAVRSWPERQHIPMLVLSGSLPQDALVAGANGVVTKPFTSAELLGKVRELVEGVAHHGELSAPSI